MRRFVFMSLFASMASMAYAQVQFVPYTPVMVDSRGRSFTLPGTEPRRQNQNFQTVAGYFVNQRGSFEKIRLKINVIEDSAGFTSVYVRGYCDKDRNTWHDMNSKASQIDVLDPAVLKENFDYKIYINYVGYVYF